MLTKEQAINRCIEKHGDKYDYSKVEFSKVTDNVIIICPTHGEFTQSLRQHYRGQGCPICGNAKKGLSQKLTQEKFIEKAKKVHGDKYDFSKSVYIKSCEKITVTCKKHGDFLITPNGLLMGRGCKKCALEYTASLIRLSTDEFIEKSRLVHGDKYDYSKTEYESSRKKVCVICKEHGEFFQIPDDHMNGHGCPECAKLRSAELRTKSYKDFITKAGIVHSLKYTYPEENTYKNRSSEINIICPIHGTFRQKVKDHLAGCGCKKCGALFSTYETEVGDYVKSLGFDVEMNNRNILNDGLEIDVYIPEKKIGIEIDGLYWHSEVKKENNYHISKTENSLSKGIRLIHIFEDEWIYKKEICKSRINSYLGLGERIFARKCDIRQIDSKTGGKFINENHIQGNHGALVYYGLFFNEELVSVMSFGNLRINMGRKSEDGHYEMIRFCNKIGTNVIGGPSKLLKHFISDYKPKEIISYCDRRWSEGDVYTKIGFKFVRNTKPSYFYVIGDKRKSRFSFRKDILISKYGCSEDDTEHNFCFSHGFYRIYDCGCKLFSLSIQ